MYPKWHLPCTMIRPIFPKSEREKEHHQMSGGVAENVCRYIVRNFSGQEELNKIVALTGCDNETLMHPENSFILLQNWLCSGKFETMNYISGFLQKMDEFNLDDYIRAIHFDSFKVPKVPFQLPVSKQ